MPPGADVAALRRRVGMVFALPLPLPGTIRENIIYGPTLAGDAQPCAPGRDRGAQPEPGGAVG